MSADLPFVAPVGSIAGRSQRVRARSTAASTGLGYVGPVGSIAGRSQRVRATGATSGADLPFVAPVGSIAGRSQRIRIVSEVVTAAFHQEVRGSSDGIIPQPPSLPWPLGPVIVTPATGHLAAAVTASPTDDVFGFTYADAPGTGFGEPPAIPAILDLAGEVALWTTFGSGFDLAARVERGTTGPPIAHAIGAAVTGGDNHGNGSVIGGAITFTMPVAGIFTIDVRGKINTYGSEDAGETTFGIEVRKGATVLKTISVPLTLGGEPAIYVFADQVVDAHLSIGDALSMWIVSGRWQTLGTLEYMSIRVRNA